MLASIGLHILVLAILIFASVGGGAPEFKPLAVMDFAYYDPEGGEAGGGPGDEPSAGPEPERAEEAGEPLPEPPEEAEPSETEAPEIIKSVSEEAPPVPVPLPQRLKEEPKPSVKAASPSRKSGARSPEAGGGGALKGEAKPGGGLGQGQGGSGGKGLGNPKALNAYASKIRSKLNRLKKYPPAAASKKIGGVVSVNFTVNRQGAVISSRMVKSSGHAALDQEAMALLKRCSPFPPMPAELPQNSLNLTVPISFKAR